MPAWSTEIADRFIRLAATDNRTFDQVQLQKLVYIAHGLCLALNDLPLTGDRPEAREFGPVYKRLADALEMFGLESVTRDNEKTSDLDRSELDIIERVYGDYKEFSGSQLSNLTRRGNTPWRQIYADGAGRLRDIPHKLIREQFVQLIAEAQA